MKTASWKWRLSSSFCNNTQCFEGHHKSLSNYSKWPTILLFHRRLHSTHALFGDGIIVTALFLVWQLFAGEVAGALHVDHCFCFRSLLNCHLSAHFKLFMQVHTLWKKIKGRPNWWRKHWSFGVSLPVYITPSGPLLPVFVLMRQNDYFYCLLSCLDLFSGCSGYHQYNALYIVTQKEEVCRLIQRLKLINFENLWNGFRFRIAILILDHFEVDHLTSGRITIHFYLVCLETTD